MNSKWFLDKLGHEGLNKMLVGFDDKTAYAQCIFAYMEHEKDEPKVFVGRTPVIIFKCYFCLSF